MSFFTIASGVRITVFIHWNFQIVALYRKCGQLRQKSIKFMGSSTMLCKMCEFILFFDDKSRQACSLFHPLNQETQWQREKEQ